jgi:hypothetical protein
LQTLFGCAKVVHVEGKQPLQASVDTRQALGKGLRISG